MLGRGLTNNKSKWIQVNLWFLLSFAGNGERMEWVQPSGERRGLAEVYAAGTNEPLWPDTGQASLLCLSDAVRSALTRLHVCVFLWEQQEKVQIRKELWRIEDVIAGLSSSKANFKVTISSVTNPGEIRAFCRSWSSSWVCCLICAAVSYY